MWRRDWLFVDVAVAPLTLIGAIVAVVGIWYGDGVSLVVLTRGLKSVSDAWSPPESQAVTR